MEKERESREEVGELRHAVDELNLAEFPLASISDRLETKTVVFEDEVQDPISKRYLPRKLTLSGSDRYGLPTASDDDVLLACIQISRLGDFQDPTVHFSRYEILKLLGWRDETRNYRRVAESLRRWKGLSVYSDRAFFDKEAESWVNRDFGILDSLYLYRREMSQRGAAAANSHFTWNEVLFKSFQTGYLKKLDWKLYCSLTSPVAKRLYRFLDKRFYHRSRVEIDLRVLGEQKVRLSPEYNTAQMKRALEKGISELEHRWCIRRRNDRFQKLGKGRWAVVFEEKRLPKPSSVQTLPSSNLASELSKRGVGPAAAEELASGPHAENVRTMVELFDWYNGRGENRGPGFLVNSIRKPSSISMPRGFESSSQIARRRGAEKNRIAATREKLSKIEAEQQRAESARRQAFLAFWAGLDQRDQDAFENEALGCAPPLTARRYQSAKREGSAIFEEYRAIILIEHFERITEAERSRWVNGL